MTPSCLAAGTRTALASPLFLRSALLAVAVSVAFASSMATAAPLPEQSGILTDDQFVQELHQLCLRIPDSDNPLSDAVIVNGVQRLFPQLTKELKDPTNLVSVDLFLSNGCAWPSNIVSRLWKPKPQPASADPNSKRRVQFVRDLIAADRGDGRKLAFAAVLTALMPSQDLGAVLADPDTLLVLLLQRTRAISPSWPLIGLWRRIVDSMTPTALIQLKDAALHLVFEIYLKPMFQSILLRELTTSQADAIRIFHRISLSATPPKVEAFAKTVISQWPAHPILWSHVFGAYLHQQLAPKIQYRSFIKGLLRRSATAYGPGVNADDLLIQLVLHSGPSMADLATMLLPLTKVPGRSVGSSTNYVSAKDFSSFLHQEFFDNICGSSSLQYRAMQHCALSGLVEPLAIAMRPCLLDISGQTLYFLIRGAPGIVDHWSDLHGVLGKLMGVSVYRLIDGCQRLGYPAGCKQPSSIMQDKFKLAAHMLTVAQTQANYDRSFSEALVQLLFLHTLDHASSVDVIRSPLWLPTAANMARLNTALVQQPIPVSHAAESIRALMAHPDMLALLKAESATHLRLDLMRVLQRLYNEAPLSDWIEIVQNPQWTPSIINLNLLRLEVVAGTVTGSVCSELIQALLHRFGYTQKKTIKRNAASVGLRDLLMELYLRSPSTEYITLIRDLPLTDTDWSTIINKELWHPSAHHLAAMNTLLSMDSKPDQAFTNMIWTLLNRPDIPDVLNGNDGAELRRLLSALMERSLGLDFVQLLKHKNWPSSLWQNVVKDQRWTLTMDNLTALREQVSKDSGPLSVCGDIIRELLARHDVKVMLNVWEQSEPLQYLLIWLFHRMVISHPDLIKSAAVSVWSPDRCWIMLVEDSRWSPSSANIGVLEAALAAHSVSYSDHLIRILFERTDVKALIATNTDESQQLRNVLLALHQTASFPDWASLFALPYWSASVWPLLLGKPDWMPTNNNLDALRKSIPADSVTDAAWIEVLDALLKHREVCCRLQEKGSASDESSLQSLLTSLYQHIPETHADSVRAKYPLYSNLFPPRDSTASGSVKGESVSGSGAHSTSG